MRIRNNKLINFILEFSQIMLVFLGVYSALMCTASSLDMIYDGKLCLLLLFAASIVFYGLFTVLETFRKGKLYGLIGITMFFLALVIRFKGALLKGIVSAANSFLKEFMNYTGTNVSLLSYADTESASAKFCTTAFADFDWCVFCSTDLVHFSTAEDVLWSFWQVRYRLLFCRLWREESDVIYIFSPI